MLGLGLGLSRQRATAFGAAPDIVQLYLDRVAADGGTALLSKAEIEALLPPDWQNASFLNIPSARKAGTLYSIIGSDFTVTRPSAAIEFQSTDQYGSVVNAMPRVSFIDGFSGYPSEQESTNLVNWSESFADYRVNRATKTDQGTPSIMPSGSLALFTAIGGNAQIGKVLPLTAGVTQTWSMLVDVSQGNFAQVIDSSSNYTSINLTTGAVVGTNNLGGVGRSKHIIGNYYWASVTFTAITTGNHFWQVSDAAGSNVATGETVAAGYFQMESGTSATSYIKTEASTGTRSKDLATLTGAGAQIGQVNSTVFVKFNASNFSQLRTALTIDDGAGGSLKFQKLASNDIRVRLLNGAATVFSIVISGSLTGLQKLAVAYSNAGYISSLNGATGAIGSLGGAQPTLTDITLGADSTNTLHWNDTVATVALWKGAKDQTQINEMTA